MRRGAKASRTRRSLLRAPQAAIAAPAARAQSHAHLAAPVPAALHRPWAAQPPSRGAIIVYERLPGQLPPSELL
jgi:hypothetical protein